MLETLLDEIDGMLSANGKSMLDLNKALEATPGAMFDMATMTGGRTLQLENVHPSLIKVIYDMNTFTISKTIPQETMPRIVDRFTRQTSFGALGGRNPLGSVSTETGMPFSKDVTLKHFVKECKFQRMVNTISHVVSTSQNEIDPNRVMNDSAARFIANSNERQMIFGDESLLGDEYDGLITQITDMQAEAVDGTTWNRQADVVLDLRGGNLSEENLVESAEKISLNYGEVDKMILPLELKADIDERFLKNTIRAMTPFAAGTAKKLSAGAPISHYNSSFAKNGEIEFIHNRYMPNGNNKASKCPTAAIGVTSAGIAIAPVTTVVLADAGAIAGSLWTAADAGNYFYKVVVRSIDGSSAPYGTGAAYTYDGTAGHATNITITIPGVHPLDGTFCYDVYRSNKNATDDSDCRFIGSVVDATGAVFVDKNLDIPGTACAFLLDTQPEVLSFRRLLPFTRIQMPFAYNSQFGQSYAYLLYGYLRILKPSMLMIKNIKVDSTWF